MKDYIICETNGNLTENLKELEKLGYKFIIKAVDKFLSGWGGAQNKKHVQLIACKTSAELDTILADLYNDKGFNYVNWNYLSNKKAIYNFIRNKSYTIRNDWTRCP